MHSESSPFPPPGSDLGTLELTVSPQANDRYWRGAGIEHSARDARLLYPPMSVNFTILLVQQTISEGVLHTWGRLTCHGGGRAGSSLTVSGEVHDRFEKRERDYFTVSSEIRAEDGTLLWTAETELGASRRRPGAGDTESPTRPTYEPLNGSTSEGRQLMMTRDLLRTYSRAGNFHSDDGAARSMGLPGMVAMGMQTLGPAYGLVLDAWGEEFVERGELEARFFGLVLEDDTVDVAMTRNDARATFAVRNATKGLDTATGSARLL